MSIPLSSKPEHGFVAVAKEPLSRQIGRLVIDGWRVESQTDQTTVMVRGRRPEHMLHFVLTMLTFGFWAIVWIFLAIFRREERIVLTATVTRPTLR
jgi:hypothetical protein